MGEDFHSAPVPIRLTCRYTNGIVVSLRARALAYGDSSMRILSSEDFEKGVQLDVLAPFLGATVSCQVLETSRSQAQPGLFELYLRLLTESPPVVQPKIDSSLEAPRPPISKEVILAARDLAARLEQGDTSRFSLVLQQFQPAQRPLLLAISAPAVALLLQEKGLLDLRHLVETIKREG